VAAEGGHNMEMTKLRDEIPKIYARLLAEDFLEQNAKESLATCNDCRMCKADFALITPMNASTTTLATAPYSPNAKCCTFYPFVPNYLVGGALKRGGEGARRIKHLIQKREWALPIGIVAPPSYQIKFTEKRPDEFGRNHDFLCPFFDQGKCAIWKFRNSECSTYFCAHDDGEMGRTKWIAIGDKLHQAEMTLTQECLIEKGYDWEEIEELLKFIKFATSDLDLKKYKSYEISALQWNQFWQHRADDPEVFYRECDEWVSQQGPSLLEA
jgi:hypothetical protein